MDLCLLHVHYLVQLSALTCKVIVRLSLNEVDEERHNLQITTF